MLLSVKLMNKKVGSNYILVDYFGKIVFYHFYVQTMSVSIQFRQYGSHNGVLMQYNTF